MPNAWTDLAVAARLGAWHAERRNLHADALRYLGAPPGDVVAVWLIAALEARLGPARPIPRRLAASPPPQRQVAIRVDGAPLPGRRMAP